MDSTDTTHVWGRVQTPKQRASALRTIGVDVLRPSLDHNRSPRMKRAINSPRTQSAPSSDVAGKSIHADHIHSALLFPKIDSELKKETLRAKAVEVNGPSYEQFRSTLVAWEVRVKEVIQQRIMKEGTVKPPTTEFIETICQALYACSSIPSSIQPILHVISPEIIKCIYNTKLPANETVQVSNLEFYPPFIAQVDVLESDRQELMVRATELERQLEAVLFEFEEYRKQATTIISEIRNQGREKDSVLKNLQDVVESLKQKIEFSESEAEKYKTMYRNNLDHYDEDLSRAVQQEVEKYSAKIMLMEHEKKTAVSRATLLKNQLDVLKQDLESSVARRDYDELKRLSIIQKHELSNARDFAENLKKAMENIQARAISEMRKREDRIQMLRQAFDEEFSRRTPRPQWDDIFGGLEKKDMVMRSGLFKETTTTGKVLLLRDELGKANDELEYYKSISSVKIEKDKEKEAIENFSSDKFFAGLGTGPEIPKHLRISGKVKNRKLSKRDTEAMIKDIWKERSQLMKSTPSKAPKLKLPDFLYQYLQNHYGLHNVVVEWAYNFIDALERYKYDGDCEIFSRTLKGQISDDVYDDQTALLDSLKQAFVKWDISVNNGKETGKLSRKEAMNVIGKFFTLKPEEKLNIIRGALLHDQSTATIQYQKLFEEDKEYNQGLFIETIRSQYLGEILEFNQNIEDGLAVLEQRNQTIHTRDVVM
eukprot:TRINITY_DN3696_c0_g1_i20.p1 TRINITY_DN3696_c0_g1~~TRINITY_DN3696_c0_g1_i20.p1  ORF type:complete len:710 (-),score=130.03 TRINITY_DN3696_c0_g1_i20:712-2841(-)